MFIVLAVLLTISLFWYQYLQSYVVAGIEKSLECAWKIVSYNLLMHLSAHNFNHTSLFIPRLLSHLNS